MSTYSIQLAYGPTYGARWSDFLRGDGTRAGIIIEVIDDGDRFLWAMRKGDERPFLHSRGGFRKAQEAEADARALVSRGKAKVAYVDYKTAKP